MISFFVTQAGSHGIRDYLTGRGTALADRVQVMEYERLAGLTSLCVGGAIFAALDQATPLASAAAAQIHDQLTRSDPPVAVLNDPRKVLRRFELLTRLHQEGCNRFKAIRALDDPRDLRFPVFIRREHWHDGSLTSLLYDRRALERALGQMVFRGERMEELLIVEFCDTTGPDGLFRKYSAMRIGDVILPRHLHIGRHWVTKSSESLADSPLVAEERRYLEEHPHELWLAAVFDLAQIEYGRIDYGLWGGEPQVWEINTNPTLGRNARRPRRRHDEAHRRLREPGRALAHRRMLEAFERLDPAADRRALPVVIDRDLRRRLERQEVAARRPPVASALLGLTRYLPLRRLARSAVLAAVAPISPLVARAIRRRHPRHGDARSLRLGSTTRR